MKTIKVKLNNVCKICRKDLYVDDELVYCGDVFHLECYLNWYKKYVLKLGEKGK